MQARLQGCGTYECLLSRLHSVREVVASGDGFREVSGRVADFLFDVGRGVPDGLRTWATRDLTCRRTHDDLGPGGVTEADTSRGFGV